MPVYNIARLNIKIDPLRQGTLRRLEPFASDSADYEFDASVSIGELLEYVKSGMAKRADSYAEGPMILTKICKKLLSGYDGFFFHSSCLELDGGAYAFTAPSGTGKSTHAALWRERFGSRVKMINDDKPVIRKIDGVFTVCSTPWMGKSEIGANLIAPLKAVFVLERGSENSAKRVSPSAVFRSLLEATLYPDNPDDLQKLLALYDEMFQSVPLVELKCNTNPDAVDAALAAIDFSAEANK